MLISSSSNTFSNVVDGLDITVNDGTLEAGNGERKFSTTSLVSNAKEFVAAYNSLRDALGKMTAFNANDLTAGILFGSSEALQVESYISNLMTSRFFGLGQFQSLAEVGISVNDKGKINLDEAKLNEAFNKDPDAVKKLFTDSKQGVSAKLNDVDRAVGGRRSSVLTREI